MELAFQYTRIKNEELENIAETLNEMNYPITSFGIIPFTDYISFNDERSDFDSPTILIGSVKIGKLFHAKKLPKNCIVFHNLETFDQCHYSEILKDDLLNYGAEFHKFGDIKNSIIKNAFVKPSNDFKYFSGMIVNGILIDEITKTHYLDSDTNDDLNVLVNYNLIENIENEYRFFIINNIIVSCCQYMECGKVKPVEIETSLKYDLSKYVTNIIGKYSPHKHYVVDIAKIGGHFKVVEYNCLNFSGMYKNNRLKIYKELLKL